MQTMKQIPKFVSRLHRAKHNKRPLEKANVSADTHAGNC